MFVLRQEANDTRGQNVIQVHSERKGHEIGFHEVSFKNDQEIITITHQALDRSLFAHGAMRILRWLAITKPICGIYTIKDTVN
jgi:4-hydroxy-tetrahydrodipicolinate reductase